MQLMTWSIARLGSRFSLLFEPYHRRVMHSALGRFLDEPLDLMVGLVEPDGTERVLPFTRHGETLYNCEQFERFNSITFSGYSRQYHLKFEFNIHSVFYPQDEALCTMPAFYLEMRVNPAGTIRRVEPPRDVPKSVRLFFRLERPNTSIIASNDKGARIDLTYRTLMRPKLAPEMGEHREVSVAERIVSLNPEATPEPDGKGLTLDLPVTEPGSGIKWRLVWGAHCGDPLLQIDDGQGVRPARARYVRRLPDIDAVMHEAITHRDDRLARSRRVEKLLEQIPLEVADKHLMHQTFQAFLSNTFWCDIDPAPGQTEPTEWFSVWTGTRLYHGAIDVEYNISMFYLTMWPRLLALQFPQWAVHEKRHALSKGSYLSHDLGRGVNVTGPAYAHDMPVEENCNFLLLLQTYSHWTGDLSVARRLVDLIERLALYLIWTDRDRSGFPSEGTANTLADATPATQYARKQTYLAVKRLAALRAAADLLGHLDRHELAERCDRIVDHDAEKVHRSAWLGDHYAVCVDRSAIGLVDTATGQPLPYDELPGWDAYSIYTGNGLLLPAMIGRPPFLAAEFLIEDLISATRETLGPYGCGHTSAEPTNVHISQNLWRDHLARYLGHSGTNRSQRYWDLQVASNTGPQSYGFIDTYINNNHSFFPRGITCLGFLLSYPRLAIDKLAPGGARISVEPDRHFRQRWPLLPLADWKAGKVPVCVVDIDQSVRIEGAVDPIIVRGQTVEQTELIG